MGRDIEELQTLIRELENVKRNEDNRNNEITRKR